MAEHRASGAREIVIEILGLDDRCFALAGFADGATDGVGFGGAVFSGRAGVLCACDAGSLFDG